ncbi:MAG: lysozyme [Chlorobiaceae bacterium]|nr:lysozyme [Chlorobiaceae bacterium]
MQISEKGLDLIRGSEGISLKAYVCPAGILTIGYGHTGPDVTAHLTITQDKANQLLRQDVARFESAVNELVAVPMTQGMFDALVSFAYNLGAGALKSSTLLKKLMEGDKAGAADEFLRWNKANGQVLNGLTVRRESERKLFLA